MRTVRGMVLIALACITSLALATPALAQAKPAPPPPPQQDTDQGVGIGALGGLNFTSVRGDDVEGTSAGTGAMFGIWFGGNRNGRVGFMGELNYVEKKINQDFEGTDATFSTKYIEIPALFRINIGSRSRNGVSVYALAGPVFDFRLSSKVTIEGITVEDEFDDSFSAVDIGILAGVGVEVNRFGFEFRVNWGQKQLATDEAVESGFVSSAKSTSIQILGKIRFN